MAQSIALAIRQKQQDGEKIVLRLTTSSRPIRIYEELARSHKERGLSFQNVVTFNLDEYSPMAKESAATPQKRRAIFMHQSQKDRPPFPGDDRRKFWQRAEDCNRETAQCAKHLACQNTRPWRHLCAGKGSKIVCVPSPKAVFGKAAMAQFAQISTK